MTESSAPKEFRTSKGKVIVAGKPAEELFRMYDTGKMILPSYFSRLTMYAHLERVGMFHPSIKLPCYQSIFEESTCYADDEKDDNFVLAVVRGQRCATWMQEQNILCKTKLLLAGSLLKAECNMGFFELAVHCLPAEGVKRLQADTVALKGQARAEAGHAAINRKEIEEAIAYAVAFNTVIEYLAVYLKIPEVMLYQVDIPLVTGMLGRLEDLEQSLRKAGLKREYLGIGKSLPGDLEKKMKIPTKAEMKRLIKDLVVFDGGFVFSATALLLKPACDDMMGEKA